MAPRRYGPGCATHCKQDAEMKCILSCAVLSIALSGLETGVAVSLVLPAPLSWVYVYFRGAGSIVCRQRQQTLKIFVFFIIRIRRILLTMKEGAREDFIKAKANFINEILNCKHWNTDTLTHLTQTSTFGTDRMWETFQKGSDFGIVVVFPVEAFSLFSLFLYLFSLTHSCLIRIKFYSNILPTTWWEAIVNIWCKIFWCSIFCAPGCAQRNPTYLQAAPRDSRLADYLDIELI